MHRIVLTGSNGLLGQKLVQLLKNKKNVSLLATSAGDNRISDDSGYEYRCMNITDAKEVDRVLSEFKPTAVINTAAMTLVDLCETEREKCHQVNVTGVANLLDSCKHLDAHLVQVSTDFVFDGEDGPYAEEDDPNPLSEYAKSKYRAEQLLLSSDYKNWSIARTIILYGVGENMSRSNVVLWARETLKKGSEMNIVHDQFRSPTLAEDLALGCWAIVERGKTGVFHLSGPETMSIIELVKRIASYYDLNDDNINPIDTRSLGQPAVRPPRTGFILDKAINELDYSPRTLEEGLALIDQQLPL
ncbi:MAG: SDR family oxidoreductase [Flavobacteriales bacterium]|nr:SDR family oxidoreductase [Flavobacteriales bacterium]NNK81239.1 SDR family oxidoreductase [Flavobacteriales bacterium]